MARNRVFKCLALVVALCVVLQILPVGATVKAKTTKITPENLEKLDRFVKEAQARRKEVESNPPKAKSAQKVEPEDDDEDDDEEEEEDNSGCSAGRKYCVEDIFDLGNAGDQKARKRKDMLMEVATKRLSAIYERQIEPVAKSYKYEEFTKHSFGEPEITSLPMVFISEPWKHGRSALIPLLLGIEEDELETDEEQNNFIIYSWGPRKRVVDGIAIVVNDTYADLTRFGRQALRHIKAVEMPHPLLERITIVEGPDVGIENPKIERGFSLEELHAWFAARADAIVLSFEPSRIDMGGVVAAVLRELDHQQDAAFFLLNVNPQEDLADQMKSHRDVVWNVAPHLVSEKAPQVYITNFDNNEVEDDCFDWLEDQEESFLRDLSAVLDERFKNRLNRVYEHALEIRSHSLLVDRFVDTYNRKKTFFGNNLHLQKDIASYPDKYLIFDSVLRLHNVSEQDLPDPSEYKTFFGVFPLQNFNTIAGSCSVFQGCPHERLQYAIDYDLAELLEKYERKLPICLADEFECDTVEDRIVYRYKPKGK